MALGDEVTYKIVTQESYEEFLVSVTVYIGTIRTHFYVTAPTEAEAISKAMDKAIANKNHNKGG